MLSRAAKPVVLAYLAFVVFGVSAGIGGVLLLAQMRDYGVDRATIGITFFTGSAGFVLAGSTAGALIPPARDQVRARPRRRRVRAGRAVHCDPCSAARPCPGWPVRSVSASASGP
jgi:hypothetical protein